MKQIFINLPVKNLEQSMRFYTQLGFTNDALFTDENQKCMIWSEQIYVMLQSKDFFGSWIQNPLSDTKNNTAATYTLPVESLDKVNEIIENGLKAGGTEPNPLLDEGFMQVRAIEDLDGHIWNIIYLDINKFKELKTANR